MLYSMTDMEHEVQMLKNRLWDVQLEEPIADMEASLEEYRGEYRIMGFRAEQTLPQQCEFQDACDADRERGALVYDQERKPIEEEQEEMYFYDEGRWWKLFKFEEDRMWMWARKLATNNHGVLMADDDDDEFYRHSDQAGKLAHFEDERFIRLSEREEEEAVMKMSARTRTTDEYAVHIDGVYEVHTQEFFEHNPKYGELDRYLIIGPYRDCFMMPNYRSTRRGGTEFGNVRIMQLDDETTKKVDGLTYYAYTADEIEMEDYLAEVKLEEAAESERRRR